MDPVREDELAVPAGYQLVVYAKNQPQYLPLPVVRTPDGTCYSEWLPTVEERAALAQGRAVRIRLWCWTFNQPLQPVKVELV